MHTSLDAHGIAERVRRLMSGQDLRDLVVTACRLGVKEPDLRRMIEGRSAHAPLDILAALVNAYGVDPRWLLYGEYDCATHRRALDEGATGANLLRLATRPDPRRKRSASSGLGEQSAKPYSIPRCVVNRRKPSSRVEPAQRFPVCRRTSKGGPLSDG